MTTPAEQAARQEEREQALYDALEWISENGVPTTPYDVKKYYAALRRDPKYYAALRRDPAG